MDVAPPAGSGLPRRRLLIGGAAALGVAATAPLMSCSTTRDERTSAATPSVASTAVQFGNAAVPLRGDLFLPERAPEAAVVFSGPMTSVKEQSAGVYARALAARGFAALAFDHRYFGASGGEPRQLEDPDAKISDIREAVNAVGEWPQTRDLPIFGLGLCIGGGYMARAVADDGRITGFAGVVGAYVDADSVSEAMGQGFADRLDRGHRAEDLFRTTGVAETIPAVGPDGGNVAMPAREAYDYYGTTRAGEQYVNGFAVQSWAHTLPFDALSAAARIRVPTVVIHSETATFPESARRFYDQLPADKHQVWLRSRGQVDFYDDPALIDQAVDAAAEHFRAVV